MRTAVLLVLVALAAPAGLCAARPARAQEAGAAEFHATTLMISAQGEVQARPDLASVNVGVGSDGPTAAEALARNRTRMSAVFSALGAQGVADRDVQTSELNLEAQYADDGKSPRRLAGYHASNAVTVRLHDLARVGPVLDALVAAGADQLNGVAFALADPQAAQDAARRLAVKALQAKAELYAVAAGYRVLRLVRLSETGGYSPPMPSAMMLAARSRVSTPVASGELTVRAEASGEYELGR